MKSFIAALRTLVLPFGAGTTDPRIVLNGTDGRIEIYTTGGALLMTLDDDGLLVYDGDGDIRQKLGAITDFSSIILYDADGLNPAIYTYTPIPGSNDYRASQILGPDTDKDFSRILLLSPNASTTKNPLLQWDTGTLHSSVAQPIADLTGFTGTREAVVVAADYKMGSSNGAGNAPTLGNSISRGEVARGIETGDITLSTTAGTYSEIVATDSGDVPIVPGRRYRMIFSGGDNMLIGGSGFATSDTWLFKFQRSTNAGGAWSDVNGPSYIARAPVAQSFRYPIPILIGNYDPATDATVRWRVVATKSAGAATVTSQLQTNGGTSSFIISVEDVGEAIT